MRLAESCAWPMYEKHRAEQKGTCCREESRRPPTFSLLCRSIRAQFVAFSTARMSVVHRPGTGPAARLAADLKANPPSSHVVTSFVGNESPSWSMSCITIALTRLLIASWLPATSLVLAHHLIRTVPGQVRSYNFR